MTSVSNFSPFLRDLFPERSDALLGLYEGAAENASLLHADFYTVRDLVELSGYEADEPVHVLLLALLLALDDGGLCVEASADGLARRLSGLVPEDALRGWARRAADRLEMDGLPALVGRSSDEPRPVVLWEDGPSRYLYFQKYLRQEIALAEVLKKRLAAMPTPVSADLAAIVPEVLAESRLRLNPAQQTALGLALLRNFVIVSGGPGTGKTSIVLSLLRCLVRAGTGPERIALAAPTGRAAQRVTDAIRGGLGSGDPVADVDGPLADLSAQTLHHLLHYHPGRGTFLHHAENPLPADVVVVDEVSMVGVHVMAQLFQALRPETRLVLLGDKDQLSSVDPGAVLASLVPPSARPSLRPETCRALAEFLPGPEPTPDRERRPLQDVLVVLEENYRSQPEIQEIARAVNTQDATVVARLSAAVRPEGCQLLESVGNVAVWRGVLEKWADEHYLQPGGEGYAALLSRYPQSEAVSAERRALLDGLFRILNGARILTLVREGPWGCDGINRHLGQHLRRRLDPGADELFAGMPVLITRTDSGRQLFNGDIGLTLRRAGGGYCVVFPRAGEYVSLPSAGLPAHEAALALTVHKSQGSEYDEVLLVLPPEGGRRLLTKEMIYTGITRARRRVVIAGGRDVLEGAIGCGVERESALLRGLIRG